MKLIYFEWPPPFWHCIWPMVTLWMISILEQTNAQTCFAGGSEFLIFAHACNWGRGRGRQMQQRILVQMVSKAGEAQRCGVVFVGLLFGWVGSKMVHIVCFVLKFLWPIECYSQGVVTKYSHKFAHWFRFVSRFRRNYIYAATSATVWCPAFLHWNGHVTIRCMAVGHLAIGASSERRLEVPWMLDLSSCMCH